MSDDPRRSRWPKRFWPMADWEPGLFAMPPGVDYAATFVDGFLKRMQGRKPEEIARVTIYTNSARSKVEILRAFDLRGPLLLPKLKVITELGGNGVAEHGPLASPLARRLQLARLLVGLFDARPDLAAGHSLSVLAHSLADLMTEMQTEGLAPNALETIDTADHASHWQNALQFLKIASDFYLSGAKSDHATRLRIAAETALDDWSSGRNLPADPVIVAGSTGSHGATREFIKAVAKLPNGAVVLPGFDFDQPQAIWDDLAESEDHPQARFAPLIAAAGYPQLWTECQAAAPARNALVSLALRPAPVTDQWISDGPSLRDIGPACEGLTLIEADQPGAEADAIALIMRDCTEHQEPVTLIAADPGLVRRVTAALDRWHLRPDDSAGEPLHLAAQGLFLRQISELFGRPLTIDRLLILLKHPLTATGSDTIGANESRLLARQLELHLRQKGPVFPNGEALRDWGARGDKTRKSWVDWLAGLVDKITGFEQDRAPRSLSDRVNDLLSIAEMLAAGPEGAVTQSRLWLGKHGRKMQSVIAQLAEHAGAGPDMRPSDFTALLIDQMQAEAIRGDIDTHPLLFIRGPREARVVGCGTVILSGLNEGEWPRTLSPDPWLSRQMRKEAGLTSPERLIGLAAHDFQQGIAAQKVFLTRAKRNAEAETIPSRWLNRLTNLLTGLPEKGGPQALADMRHRGAAWLQIVSALGRPEGEATPAKRPSPIPPAPAFRELPVTDIETLIRDSYAIYAKRVLNLRRLNPLRPDPDPALRGQVLHSIVERFLKSNPTPDTEPDALKAILLQITAEVLAEEVPWPSARAFWHRRIENIADQLIADELARLREGRPHVIETRGAVSITGMDFRLTAKPDRIDLRHDGQAVIYDYKSGEIPSDKQIAQFNKQLILEAAMVRRGGFPELGPVDVAGMSYIALGGSGETKPRTYSPEFEQEQWDGFITLLQKYLLHGQGFTAMRSPKNLSYRGDYDHLSRFGEWSLADIATPEKVGDHD